MFYRAITTKDTYTENAMPAHSTSSNNVLDMFFKMGGSRGMSEGDIVRMFSLALNENPLLTLKALFYNRDIRGGQGERRSFRIMFKYLCENYPKLAIANLHLVPEYGRWDDIFSAFDTSVQPLAIDFILSQLKAGDKLCAKWMPRENKSGDNYAKILMSAWHLSPRQYRKLLAGNTDVVESQMCAREWKLINYNHVPSKAINNYRSAFMKHDAGRFSDWLASLAKPESGNKIHAGAIFPHDIVKGYMNFGRKLDATLEAQWKALPNYVPEGRKILPVCDVSGSMTIMDGLPMRVSVSLGIYLSERNVGPFKDGFITFSAKPTLQILKGNLLDRVNQLETSKWDMNTDLEAVFHLILSKAREYVLAPEEMPNEILILSDMQFDRCVQNPNNSAMDMIRDMYARHGYAVPNVIFWNLRTGSGVPVKFDERGVALVSGFSPSLMKSLLNGDLTPMKMMLSILESERYSKVTI